MRRRTVRAAAIVCLALLAACAAAVNTYYDSAKPHHTPEGFRNNYMATVAKPFSMLARWRWEAWRDDLPPPPQQPTPAMAPDLDAIHANGHAGTDMRPAVTWIGHATMLVQAGGLNVLTDPMFSERAFPVQLAGPKRAQPPGVALKDLPPIDVVIVSHNHYDHLDRASVVALNALSEGRTLFLVPLGNKRWFESLGIANVVELDWWQRHAVRGVDFHLVPVQHWSARGFTDRNETLWGGWAVFGPGLNWYFGGDTGYSKDFADARARLVPRHPEGFGLALLPVGAYAPRWFMREQHMDPAEAVQAHKDLGARRSIGIHWGTFALTDEPLDQPPKDLAQARRAAGLADDAFSVLKIGETRRIDAQR